MICAPAPPSRSAMMLDTSFGKTTPGVRAALLTGYLFWHTDFLKNPQTSRYRD